ncbi:MAG: ABC transporter substrate-binding protein [Lachnospiraceae bacterium]|nr:ABC transporter substrate-binding protein [Lachnospiraceae bacterium]
MVDITMEGGTGRAHIESPVEVTKTSGALYAKLVWSSSNYDYVIVDGVRYDNENPGGPSTFTVPVKTLDEPLKITGDTVAMSTPHEIDYTVYWNTPGEQGLPEDEDDGGDKSVFGEEAADHKIIVPGGLEKTGEVPLKYAKGFKIDLYGDYTLINVYGVGAYLIVPEGGEVPGDITDGNSFSSQEDMTVLNAPFDATYLVSTSAMDLVRQCGCLDRIRFSPLEADDWYVDEAKERIRSGQMVYAGKYRAPDYELLVGGGCDLAIENTMIYYDPEVMEKLKELGIPVIVETSSYEKDPLGRLEWIKLYGVLFGCLDEAEAFFDAEAARVEAIEGSSGSKKTVVFFSVSSTGMVSVRKSGDYMVKLIELAGGQYVPKAGGEDATSSMNMQMEDFYAAAKDADVMIYNSTIEEEPQGISSLTGMNELFSDFKAVKEGNVYCLRSGFFQNMTKMADLIEDMDKAFSKSPEEMKFLYKLE